MPLFVIGGGTLVADFKGKTSKPTFHNHCFVAIGNNKITIKK
jgi:hypothetical protein